MPEVVWLLLAQKSDKFWRHSRGVAVFVRRLRDRRCSGSHTDNHEHPRNRWEVRLGCFKECAAAKTYPLLGCDAPLGCEVLRGRVEPPFRYGKDGGWRHGPTPAPAVSHHSRLERHS